MSSLAWYTDASALTGTSVASVYDKRYAKLVFNKSDIRAIYIDWDDGVDNSKDKANYQWVQFDSDVSQAIVEHTYTQTGSFKPVIQTVNSQGIFSKYFQNSGSNSDIAPFEESTRIAGLGVGDKAATSVINLENKQVLSGIDNSYFDKYGPQDIYFALAPTLVQGDIYDLIPNIEIEADVVYGMVSGSEGTSAGGASATITFTFNNAGVGWRNGYGVTRMNDGTTGTNPKYKVKRINKVKWVNSRCPLITQSDLDKWNQLKLFILTSGAALTAGGGSLIPYYPVAYLTDGVPIKTSDDAQRIVNFDMSQSRTSASNTSLTNYRYDNGNNWFVPNKVWASDASKLTAVSGSTAGSYDVSYTYTPRPDGLMQKGTNTDANSDRVIAFASGSSFTWYTDSSSEPRQDQFIMDDFNRFVPQGHLLRTWVSGNGGMGSSIDTYRGIFRISPALNWDNVGDQSPVGYTSQSICRNFEDLRTTQITHTVDSTVAGRDNTAGNSGEINLDGVNTLSYLDRNDNARTAYEYLILIGSKKHNKIFVQASPYAKDLMSNSTGGTNQTEIAGLYYLNAENNRTNIVDMEWKPLKFTDSTKVTKEYRNESDDTYDSVSASFVKSGFIEFDEPLDWSAVSMYDIMGQNSNYLGYGTAEGTIPSATPTANSFEFTFTCSCSAASGGGTQGKTATFIRTAGAWPTAISGAADNIGAYKYLAIMHSGSAGGSASAGIGMGYWLADGFADGYDGTDTITLQIGNQMYWGGGAPSTYGSFLADDSSYTFTIRRINWYDVIDGASTVWSSNADGAAKDAFILNPVDSRDDGPWHNYFSFMSGSSAGPAMGTAWANNDSYLIKMVLKGTKWQSGSTSSSPATGSTAGVMGPEVWNMIPYDNSFSQYVEEVDDHAYALTSLPITSDISIGRKGNFYEAITRKGKVYIAKTGIGIQKIAFSSVALGDEGDTVSSNFDSHGPGTLYGYLKMVRELQAESVRVYWDEKQKDGTYVRFWGIITDVTDTRGASGPRSVVNYSFNMTVEEIAIYDGNNLMISDIYPLGGLEDVRTYS